MASVSHYSVNRQLLAEPSAASISPIHKSEARIDIFLLISALFLQRFSLSFGNSLLSLDLLPVALIFVHQFVSGRLFVQYDRLLWFCAMFLAVTSSLLLNFQSTMLSSYGLFVVIYSLFTLSRPSTPEQYKTTLQGFQFLVLILSWLAIAQFAAQFVVDGREIIRFFGILPDFLFASQNLHRANTIIPITAGSRLIKSNGIFLTEPSTMSQMAALGILIEVLEFRRPRYLLALALGLLLSYSGTGISILLLFLPLAGLVKRRAQIPVLLVSLSVFALLATGVIDLSIFSSRVGEFEDPRKSGFQRFIASFWMAAEHFDTASLPVLLRGAGPGAMDSFTPRAFYVPSGGTWFKLFYEYGLIGAFVFTCFLGSCFRRSRCPKLVIAALIYYFVFTGNLLLTTPFLILTIVLCTLHGPAPRHSRIGETSRSRSFVAQVSQHADMRRSLHTPHRS
jgi:hypothetical protein